MQLVLRLALLTIGGATGPAAQQNGSFVNWETPQVHPLERTPGGELLLATNTADARLEVFRLEDQRPVLWRSIPVGIDPVSVRARSDEEAWVVNQISDSVSIVDLVRGTVVRTLAVDDEPADVVFAGTPERAFVSCGQTNSVLVFELADLNAAPRRIRLEAEEPRALAVSPSGETVYVAIFESGNGTTVLGGGIARRPFFPPNAVSDPAGPYGGVNPPPNRGADFEPPLREGLPEPPPVSLIVRRDGARWYDDNGADWTALVSGARAHLSGRPVGWELVDHDVAVIDAGTLAVEYVDGLMNLNMAIAIQPSTGDVTVVGTDAHNEIRFESNLRGRFVDVMFAKLDPRAKRRPEVRTLNPDIAAGSDAAPAALRRRSVGDPRAVIWTSDGRRGFVAGMGSNSVVAVNERGVRVGSALRVGAGPTGLVLGLHEDVLYVLNRFDASISVVSLAGDRRVYTIGFHDSTPASIRSGRRHLYDTQSSSGNGALACASCHVDARMDRLAWDLGDPGGELKYPSGLQNLGGGETVAADLDLTKGFKPWHPMKGPMLTQTLRDIIGKEPFHFRGDRDGIEGFADTFVDLMAADEPRSPAEMQELEDFLATIHYPPNPYRELDNEITSPVVLSGMFTTDDFGTAGRPLPEGDPERGEFLFTHVSEVSGYCVTCHTRPTGYGSGYRFLGPPSLGFEPIPLGPNGEARLMLVPTYGMTNVTMKVPSLRNLHERAGMEVDGLRSLAGFGYLHDGSAGSLSGVLANRRHAGAKAESDQDVADMMAFLFASSGEPTPRAPTSFLGDAQFPGPPGLWTHAAVGRQLTLSAEPTASELEVLDALLLQGNKNRIGLVVHGLEDGVQRGWSFLGRGLFQSDRVGETITKAELYARASVERPMTWTAVPKGSETRLGIDRDEDGVFDGDEVPSPRRASRR